MRVAVERVSQCAALLVSVAAAVAAHPAEMQDLAGDRRIMDTLALDMAFKAASYVSISELEGVRDALGWSPAARAALAALAVRARDLALSAPLQTLPCELMFFFSLTSIGLHPPRSTAGKDDAVTLTALTAALREATIAFNFCMSHKDYLDAVVIKGLVTMMTRGIVFSLTAPADWSAHRADYPDWPADTIVPCTRFVKCYGTAPFIAILEAARAMIAAATVVVSPSVQADVIRVLGVLYCSKIPVNAIEVPIDHAAVALDAAVDILKFIMALPPAPPPDADTVTQILRVWICSSAFADANMLLPMMKSPETEAETKAMMHVKAAWPPSILNFLRFVGLEADAMRDTFLRRHILPILDDQSSRNVDLVCILVAGLLADSDRVLAPAQTSDDSKGLQVFNDLVVHCVSHEETKIRVAGLAAVAAGADCRDEAHCVARAKLLAELDCTYLGCSNVRVQGAGSVKRCTGCRTRYDWRSHRIACKAIQAENNT